MATRGDIRTTEQNIQSRKRSKWASSCRYSSRSFDSAVKHIERCDISSSVSDCARARYRDGYTGNEGPATGGNNNHSIAFRMRTRYLSGACRTKEECDGHLSWPT